VTGDDEVLVRVVAAGLNHADWVYTSGIPLISRPSFGARAPKTIVRGKDLARVVERISANVTAFRPGDEVYGELESGTFAPYVGPPALRLTHKPANLNFEQAATVPLSGMTAPLGLRDAGEVEAGQRVLINGASGGVGAFAVQIAKTLGAEVTAVSSARNAELVRSPGADHVIDFRRNDFTPGPTRYDVIFDLIGNHGPMELRSALTPAIDRTSRLADVPAALPYFVKAHARGKVAITLWLRSPTPGTRRCRAAGRHGGCGRIAIRALPRSRPTARR